MVLNRSYRHFHHRQLHRRHRQNTVMIRRWRALLHLHQRRYRIEYHFCDAPVVLAAQIVKVNLLVVIQ